MTTISGGTISRARNGSIGGGPLTPFWFDCASPVSQNSPVSNPSNSIVYRDRNILSGSTTTTTDFLWNYIIPLNATNSETISRSTSNSNVIVPSSTYPYLWKYVGPGSAVISMSCSKRTVNAYVTTSTSTNSVNVFSSWLSSSCAKQSSGEIDSRINAITIGADPLSKYTNIFSSGVGTSGPFTWNSNFWAYDIIQQFTCFSPWNSNGGSNQAGTLISPRHLLLANHYAYGVGTSVKFVKTDGTIVTRTVTGYSNSSNYDLFVAILDSDVDSGISFAKYLSPSCYSQLPINDLSYPFPFPCVICNQQKQAFIGELTVGSPYVCNYFKPTVASRVSWFTNIGGGDSGSPVFIIINGQLVIMGCLFFSVFCYTNLYDTINGLMASVSSSVGASSNYQLTAVDLSGFPTY